MNVQIVLYDGFDLLDVIAPYEVFVAAAMYSHEEVSVKLVSAEGERMVTSGVNQLKLHASERLDLNYKGIILVPGASGSVVSDGLDSIPVKLKQAKETALSNLLKEAIHKTEILLATVCGGSLILAMDGLLEGRHAVTHHMGMDLLNATNAIPVNARIVDDGDLITGGGVTSGLDVALYIVERELGPRIAHVVEQLFEYERRGTVWKAEGNAPKKNQENPNEATRDHSSIQNNKKVNIQGKWDTIVSTPIGKLSVLFDLTAKDGQIIGTAKQGEDIVTLENLVLDGNQLKWCMTITKPMRLSLKFSVFIEKNNMYGEAKAGKLPACKLTGTRISQIE
ncbi:DJ-1/PfpI family protein [Bacillus sp. T33-2]|uniref:DJ-1/PfpI family protein n=1 Tax=Bacillus sp. T33-2 TaxID=2054168 RepID=UPI000C776607|nr:DJ-1/PfpI family protein [Bacillus sp. T33-2]PLR99054.1 DJ-1/PfpI family protein [Bacillus sp. T33-2]